MVRPETEGPVVAVVGGGVIGRTIGSRLAAAGAPVLFGVRDPAGASASAVSEAVPGARVVPLAEALGAAAAVVVAIPGTEIEAFAREHGAVLTGRVVLDATNDGRPERAGRLHHMDDWARLAPGAHVFRAFNTVGWEVFAEPDFAGEPADLFYCGPDAAAPRALTEDVVSRVGLRPVRVGGPEAADVLDGVAKLWFALVRGQGHGRRLAFRMLR